MVHLGQPDTTAPQALLQKQEQCAPLSSSLYCVGRKRKRLRRGSSPTKMSAHSQHAYFAYLPHPTFVSSVAQRLTEYSIPHLRTQYNGCDFSTKPDLETDQSCYEDLADLEMSGVAAWDVNSSRSSGLQRCEDNDLYAIECVHERGQATNERTYLPTALTAERSQSASLVVDCNLAGHGDLLLPREHAQSRETHIQQVSHRATEYPRHVRSEASITSTQHERVIAMLSTQMVIRSQRGAAGLADLGTQSDTPFDRMSFGALIASAENISEDALVVNHPCRYYDVANFIDRWSQEDLANRTSLPLVPEISTKLQQLDQQRYLSRRMRSASEDVQGVPWMSFGTNRAQALETRCSFNSSTPGNQANHQSNDEYLEGREYGFHSFHARHKARFGHYQLRNMLSASNRNTVYYAAGSTVHVASLAFPTAQSTKLDLARLEDTALSFHITCLSTPATTASCNAELPLIAGGFNGEYAIFGSGKQRMVSLARGYASNEYNGLITHITTHLRHQSGSPCATLSSNDCCIRTLDISTNRFLTNHKYCASINATATSPDGRLRLQVSDDCEPLITNAEQGTTLVTLSSHTDFGFACAWSPDSRYAATAAQDGRTNLWDSRSWTRPLATLHSKMSCARSLHFTDDNILFMAENDDVVSIWDCTQGRRQDLRFFGSVAGVSLLDGGAEVVVANADRTVGGLLVFDREARAHDSDACHDVIFPRRPGRVCSNRARDTLQDLLI